MEEQREGLLDRIWWEVGCENLSDLRLIPGLRKAIWQAVRRIPEQAFPQRQWWDALAYLTGQPRSKPAASPRRKLLQRLEELVRE